MGYQHPSDPIDVSRWESDAEFNPYPVGARDKSLLISPDRIKHKFLISKHRYLYKHSSPRYPEQYWVEIFAYRLSKILGIDVPPAYVGYDSDNGTCGAVIEWFLKQSVFSEPVVPLRTFLWRTGKRAIHLLIIYYLAKALLVMTGDRLRYLERYTPGGDFLQRAIHDYDRKLGRQHNFEYVSKICDALSRTIMKHDWKRYWVSIFIFDALLGNTDRHQDNLGV